MADWTLTLTDEHESALEAMTEQWLVSQPETTWTPQLVLETLVCSTLASTLRSMDQELTLLTRSARAMTRAQYLPLIQSLSGAQKARLQQLLGEPRT